MASKSMGRAARPLIGLVAVFFLLFGGIFAGQQWGSWVTAPKLALDLKGGTEVILNARTTNGAQVTPEAISEAIAIMTQRLNATGVAEVEITAQGGNNIVVDVPGQIDQQTSELLRRTALLSFRPVLTTAQGTASPTESPSPASSKSSAGKTPDKKSSSGSQGKSPKASSSSAKPTSGKSAPGKASPSPSSKGQNGIVAPGDLQPVAKPSGSSSGSDSSGSSSPAAPAAPGGPSSALADVPKKTLEQFSELDCTVPANRSKFQDANPKKVALGCSDDGAAKYILGPVEVKGSDIATASAAQATTSQGQPTGGWDVNINFKGGAATKAWGDLTTRLFNNQGAEKQLAVVLDGRVVSAPVVQAPQTGGNSQITGDFTQDEADQLANQLKFGALPLAFGVQSESQISATLGTDQLQKGIIAGLIGLVLVMLYSLLQYRLLGFVTILSLVLAAFMTYATITVLSNLYGYRLSLAGVAGLIVAIGFVTDSFIVYFERVRDEIRDGKTTRSAVERGWQRARPTIIASDTVNLLAAVVLYVLSVGSVRGFAFALGITTIIDLVIVFLFTHPVLRTLARTRFFGAGHPLSGLDPTLLGVSAPAYAGRGRIRGPDGQGATSTAPPSEDDEDREDELIGAGAPSRSDRRRGGRSALAAEERPLSIAERKARLREQPSAAAGDVGNTTEREAE